MLILQMRRAELSDEQFRAFPEILARIPERFRPLIYPTLAMQAQTLGVPIDLLRRRDLPRPRAIGGVARVDDGEILTTGTSIYVLATRRSPRRARVVAGGEPLEVDDPPFKLELNCISQQLEDEGFSELIRVLEDDIGLELQPDHYPSRRFAELKAEGREAPDSPSEAELAGSHILGNRAARTLAIAIKASGGLLVPDLARQLPPDTRDQTEQIYERLQAAGLVGGETVVICTKTQAQTTRAPSKELVHELSARGLKCACGRPLAAERIEEALTITELGRSLLEKSRWLTVLLLEELRFVGVTNDQVLIEQQMGGDEIDCLANVSGELVLFELKDKEFNLGNAYSFGAKIGIVRPDHPVIVSTEHVGNDAKEHFQRAGLVGRRAFPEDLLLEDRTQHEILYIEGVDGLRRGVRELAEKIYSADARQILERVLPLASIDAQAVVTATAERVIFPVPAVADEGVSQPAVNEDVLPQPLSDVVAPAPISDHGSF